MNELKAEKEENCAKNGKEGGVEEKREVVEGLVFRCVLYMGKPRQLSDLWRGHGRGGLPGCWWLQHLLISPRHFFGSSLMVSFLILFFFLQV